MIDWLGLLEDALVIARFGLVIGYLFYGTLCFAVWCLEVWCFPGVDLTSTSFVVPFGLAWVSFVCAVGCRDFAYCV